MLVDSKEKYKFLKDQEEQIFKLYLKIKLLYLICFLYGNISGKYYHELKSLKMLSSPYKLTENDVTKTRLMLLIPTMLSSA